MTKYKIAAGEYIIVDGMLWHKVPAQDECEVPDNVGLAPNRKHKNKRGGRGKRISDEIVQKLRAEFAAGSSASSLADKYGVSIAAVYKNTAGVNRTNNRYICEKGHRFQSNLNMLDAKCPNCGSHDLERDIDKPVNVAE